jgi:hypothetical protein
VVAKCSWNCACLSGAPPLGIGHHAEFALGTYVIGHRFERLFPGDGAAILKGWCED